MPAVLPFNESSHELIAEIARALEPYFADVTAAWRSKISEEFHFDERALAALERIQIVSAGSHLARDDFQGFIENLSYFGTRLAKLKVDTRLVAFSLKVYQEKCEPYLVGLFGERHAEALAALETLSSATFVAVSGAYFDAKSGESAALLSVLDAELASGTLSTLLRRVLEISRSTFGASLGVVLLQEEPETLKVKASVGIDGGLEDGFEIPLGEGLVASIPQSGKSAISLDAAHDVRVKNPALKRLAKTLWGMPLLNEGRPFGALVLGFDRSYEWLPTERELMAAIAERLSLAIDRAQIAEALRERETRIAELSGHLLRVQEEERKHISRELHDETGQALMVIRLYLGMLDTTVTPREARAKIRETLAVVDRTIEGIRRIIGRLSPLVLQELGLVAAIRKESKDLARNCGVRVRTTISDNVGRLDPETEMALYRIVQEALHNVAKHAHAKAVAIQMVREPGAIRLVVEDDGVGMAAKNSNSRGHSFGQAGIRERVKSMGGSVHLHSAKGKGTRLEVTVPAREAMEVPAQAAAAVASSSVH
ncbi:MAG TPA: ATP-binding protein [Terriglobales bacterium]|nr:ATP-binding protein [Terriglobales bacterium]